MFPHPCRQQQKAENCYPSLAGGSLSSKLQLLSTPHICNKESNNDLPVPPNKPPAIGHKNSSMPKYTMVQIAPQRAASMGSEILPIC